MSDELDRIRRRHRKRRRLTQQRIMAAVLALASVTVLLVAVRPRFLGGTSSKTSPGVARPRTRSRLRGKHLAVLPPRPMAGRDSAVPILMYHVINPPPRDARFPGLFVAPTQFTAQMNALAAAGFRAVTLDQIAKTWLTRAPLPPGHPIVISFDNGYRSQYTNALPVLRRLGWPAVENLQLSGLPPSQGGLDARQVRALLRAGWELDTQGFTHADLPTLSAAQLRHEIVGARILIRRRYHVPANWFCYPSGLYDDSVVAVVKSAGYSGATTVIPGWATRTSDRYRLPRLRVLANMTPQSVLALIAGTRASIPPPPEYG